jgi:hypothetical protein
MTRNGGRRTLQDRRLSELSGSKRIVKACAPNQNTTFSTESANCCHSPASQYRRSSVPYYSSNGHSRAACRRCLIGLNPQVKAALLISSGFQSVDWLQTAPCSISLESLASMGFRSFAASRNLDSNRSIWLPRSEIPTWRGSQTNSMARKTGNQLTARTNSIPSPTGSTADRVLRMHFIRHSRCSNVCSQPLR